MKPFLAGPAVALGLWTVAFAQTAAAPPVKAPEAGVEQSPDSEAPIQVNVNVVNVLASVRDKHNTLIPNLSKDDFEIYENGQPETIKYFTRETNLPLTLGLLVDVSASQGNLIEIERRAAAEFFHQVLKSKDEAFIISFGSDSELLQDITSSPRLLEKALDDLKPNFGFSGIHPSQIPGADQPHGTVLYDAVYLAATDRLANEVGRKAIVLITDGVDQGSKISIKRATEYAQKSDAAIYGIYYVDPYFYSRGGFSFGGGGERYLNEMSGETGGHVYKVDRKNTLDLVFNQLQEEMRTQYAIGYTPTDPKRDGSYRKLEVRVKNKDYKVQARKGYYAMPAQKE